MKRGCNVKISTTTFIVIVIVFLALIMQGCKGGSQEVQQGAQQEVAARTPETVKDLLSTESQKLCDEFKDAAYEVSCSEALELALKDSPGTVEKVLVGEQQVMDVSTGKLVRITKTVWEVDIKLKDPFVAKSGEEVKRLAILIGANEDIGIQRKPIG